MRWLLRIRVISLILLTTLVSLVSYFCTSHRYTHTTYRYVMQVPKATVPPVVGWSRLPNSTTGGTIVSFKPVRIAEKRIDYEQICKDLITTGLVVLVVYGAVLFVNRGHARSLSG